MSHPWSPPYLPTSDLRLPPLLTTWLPPPRWFPRARWARCACHSLSAHSTSRSLRWACAWWFTLECTRVSVPLTWLCALLSVRSWWGACWHASSCNPRLTRPQSPSCFQSDVLATGMGASQFSASNPFGVLQLAVSESLTTAAAAVAPATDHDPDGHLSAFAHGRPLSTAS